MARPLEGIRVVDLSRHLPGPLATALLADLGAGVVKVEAPGSGDPLATLPPLVDGVGAVYRSLSVNKVRVALDLQAPRDRDIFTRLLDRADALVVAFRPTTLEALDLLPEKIMASHPRLIYCSLSSTGLTGDRDRPLHDLNVQALSGLLSLSQASKGYPAMPDVPFVDQAAGILAAVGILAALRVRDSTGRGALVDLSLRDVGAYLNIFHLAPLLAGAQGPGVGGGLLTGRYPFYNLYRTRDGRYISVGAIEEKFRVALAELLGIPRETLEDPHALPAVAKIFARRNLSEWCSLLDAAGIPYGPLLEPEEVAVDPALRERHLVVGEEESGAARVGHPLVYQGIESSGGPPDRDAMLRGMGLGADEVRYLLGKDEVRSP